MENFGKNKWMAIGLIIVMLFTLMPVNYNIGMGSFGVEDNTVTEQAEVSKEDDTEELTESESKENQVSSAEQEEESDFVSTETLTNTTEAVSTEISEESVTEEVTTENSTLTDSETSEEEGALKEPEGAEKATVIMEEEEMDTKLANGTENLFVGTSIDLRDLVLEASYKDENGKTVVKNMTTTEELELPKDAKIDMTFRFVIGDGSKVDCNKEYIYQVPPEVRVDVNATHELKDNTGKSIGNVKISSDGTMAFIFYEDVIKDQVSVPFYVKFAGGFSSSVQDDLGNQEIRFPTASGEFTYKVDVTDKGDDTEIQEPGEVRTYKNGNKVYRDGKPYIEWVVEIDKNGRDKLTAEVVDNLPAGLTFVEGQTITLQDERYGSSGSVKVSSVSGQKVTFEIKDSDPNYRTKFSFLTSYDDSIFSSLGSIQNWSAATVDNTVAVNPEGEPTGSEGKGSAYVTPMVLEKSVVNSDRTDADGNKLIEWKVVINRDGMDIENSTYTDTLSKGLALVGGISGVKIEPSNAGSVSATGDGFTFQPSASANHQTITLTYTTSVEDSTIDSMNRGHLTGSDNHYNISVSSTVPGEVLLTKRAVSYNSVTKLFTWEVVVNESGLDLKNAVLEEILPGSAGDYTAAMELVSVSVRDEGSNAGEDATDKLSGNRLTLGDIETKKIVTVVTRLKEDSNTPYVDGRWYGATNTAKLTYGDGKEVSKSATYNFQYSKPNLMDKDGRMTGKGTIMWYLIIYQPQLRQEKIEISDVLPAGTELVDGSVKLLDRWNDYTIQEFSGSSYQYDKTTNTLNLTLTEDLIGDYMQREFRIAYETRPTDYKNTNNNSYTNHADISVTYEGDVQVTDTEEKTVTGDVGGTLGKEYAYQSGKDYVDWSVKINEGHYDMSDIENPVIKDKLESYFDFVSDDTYQCRLYRTTKDGKRSEVPAGEYTVVVINGSITVRLPKIGTDALEFAFRTRFNISAERIESEGIRVKNTVDFEGDGFSKSDTSDEVGGVSFSSSSAGSVLEKELRIKKVDAVTGEALKGAVFELFFDGVSAGIETTGEDGFAVFKGISSSTSGISYTLQETQAPDGYVKPEQSETITIHDADLKADVNTQIRYIEHVVKNSPIEQKTELFVYKTDNNAGRVTSLKGAVFTLYKSQDDAVKGANAVASQTTLADGIVKFTVDYSDEAATTYYIRETTAPDGYAGTDTIYRVIVNTDGTVNYLTAPTTDITVEGGSKEALHVTNRKVQASMRLTKVKTGEETTKISGAEFSLYSDANCTDFIEKQTTGANGELTFSNLELGKTYYYRETKAPNGYVISNTIYSFQAGTGKEHEDIRVEETVTDDEALGLIRIKKMDDSTPSKALEGITFTLWQNDAQVMQPGTNTPYEVQTDVNGIAVFEQLPFGTYIVKENGNTGYVTATDQTVVVDSTDGYDLEIVNERIKFNVLVTKTDDSVPAKPLEGVTFGLYTSSGSLYRIGSTDENGRLSFTDIPYGNYTLRETAGIKGYIMSTDVTTITTDVIDADADKNLSYTYINKKENASIRFQKRVEGTTADWLQGAEFTLYDSNGLKVATAVSKADGTVLFENLIYDTYTIRETRAPINYKLDNTEWQVEVTENKTYDTLYNLVDASNQTILENTELPPGYEYVSFYVMKNEMDDTPLPSAKFEFLKYVEKDGKWQWESAATAYSQADGKVEFLNIAISDDPKVEPQYQVREVEAPPGYKLNPNNVKIYTYQELTETQIPGKDQVGHIGRKDTFTNVPVIETFNNEQILGKIRVLKTGLTSLNKLKGAVFGLYNQDGSEYQKNGKHYTATTDAEGIAMFEDLPIGYYIVKELEAPQGYTLNTVVTPAVNILDETTVNVTFTDTPISVTINKYAEGGATELEGAELAVYDKEGNQIDKWTTEGEGTQHSLPYSKLKVGERYTLKEIKAPDGYRVAEDVLFEIMEDGTLHYISGDGSASNKNVIMRDERLSLKVRKVDADARDTDLVGALLEVIEDATGETVYSFTSTGSERDIPYNKLKAPSKEGEYTRYTIHEKSAPTPTDSAPNGYQLAEDIQIAIGYDGTVYQVTDSGMTPLANGTVAMEDRAKKAVYFSKLDAGTGNRIAGAKLGIYSANNMIEEWISTTAPKEIELTPGDYFFREITAPDGYKKAAEIAFTMDADGKLTVTSGDGSGLSYDKLTLSMKDEPLNIRMRKLTAEYAVLPGAKFELHESDVNATEGKLLQSFTTEISSTLLDYTKLKEGGYYLLKETEAPKGYKLALPVLFYIKEGNAVNAVTNVAYSGNLIQIVDDNKVFYINKMDADTNQSLSGVTLRISSADDADFVPVEWLTDGNVKEFQYLQFKPDVTYTLSEVTTIGGYTYAEDIDFSIHSADDELYIGNNAASNNQIIMKDQPFKVLVDKQIAGSDKPLAGATLAVKNANGEILEQWVTDGSLHELDASKIMVSLQDENIYTLCELEAPELYAVSQPIDFVVTKEGVVRRIDGKVAADNTIVMYDEYRGIIFSKQDAGGKEIPGAVLTITSVDDTEFTPISWTSTTTPYNLDAKLFKPNVDYILTETAAPDGYAYAESITFRVDENGTVYVNGQAVDDKTVTMVDNVLKLSIAKADAGKKNKLLAGAKFSILLEETDTVIYSWTSKGKAKEIPQKYLLASTDEERIVYVLREDKAPEGYELAEDIRFYIGADGEIYILDGDKETLVENHLITLYDKKKEVSSEKKTKTTSKKTGDMTPVRFVITLFLLSIAGLYCLLFFKKRKDRRT